MTHLPRKLPRSFWLVALVGGCAVLGGLLWLDRSGAQAPATAKAQPLTVSPTAAKKP